MRGRHRKPSRAKRMAVVAGTVPVAAAGVSFAATPAHAETLSPRQVAGVVTDAGFPCVVGTAVALAESGGNTDAHNPNGENSWGLFQINLNAHARDFDPTNAASNARKAKEIFNAAGGWGPWGAFTDGRYTAYLDEARAACGNPASVHLTHSAKVGKHHKKTYTVRSGDTLSDIAADHDTTWQRLYKHNRDVVDNPDLIYPGEKLDLH